MSRPLDSPLLDAVLDSWDRNNTILVNLLRAVPDGGMEIRTTEGGRSIAQLFTHMHYVRLVFVEEDAPEAAVPVPSKEWMAEADRERIAAMLNESARVVREAARGRIESRRDMDQHYDHPLLMLEHMIWHEGYHHGQIKLALKLAGRAIPDPEIGRGTWGVWMRKKQSSG